MQRCRWIIPHPGALGACSDAEAKVPPSAWDGAVDAAYCIVAESGRQRWPALAQALRESGLWGRTRLVFNSAPCGRCGAEVIESRVKANYHSHAHALKDARKRGVRRALVLEDDVYFDTAALPTALARLQALVRSGAAALLPLTYLGGVYTSMRPVADGVGRGRAVQFHAYVAVTSHPAWDAWARAEGQLPDVAMQRLSDGYQLMPPVAFQRNFAASAPQWPLGELDPLQRCLTRLMLACGQTNCWETCSRRVNWAVSAFGSIPAALLSLGALLAAAAILVGALVCALVRSRGST